MKSSSPTSLEKNPTLNAILVSMSERAGHAISLDQLLQRWMAFVQQVELGYEDSIYEYTNDLSIRDLLQEILDGVSSDLQTKLLKTIKPFDERFFKATRREQRALVPRAGELGTGPWWFRVPTKLCRELENDLRIQ